MDSALLVDFVAELEASLKRSLKEMGAEAGFARLTTSQLRYINATAKIGESGPAALAVHLGVTKASATVAINRLVGMKLVSKKPSMLDQRAVSLKLTALGLSLVTAKRRALEDYAAHVSSVLNRKDVARLEKFLALLVAKVMS